MIVGHQGVLVLPVCVQEILVVVYGMRIVFFNFNFNIIVLVFPRSSMGFLLSAIAWWSGILSTLDRNNFLHFTMMS